MHVYDAKNSDQQSFVEVLCGSTLEGWKSNCMDPVLESSFFVDGSGMVALLKESWILSDSTAVAGGKMVQDKQKRDETPTKPGHSEFWLC